MTQLTAGTNLTATYDAPTDAVTLAVDMEAIRDAIAALLVAGANVTITPDDVADTITIATAGLDAEGVRDLLATTLVAGANITLTPDDVADTLTVTAAASAGLTDPTTTKGDLLARDASAVVRLPVGADGEVLTADSTAVEGVAWAAAAGGGGGAMVLPKPQSSRWYDFSYAFGGGIQLSTAVVANTLYAAPFLLQHETAFDFIGCFSQGTTATNLRMGIYAAAATGLPGALVVDAGEIASSTIGARFAAITETLTPGLYFLAITLSAALNLTFTSNTGALGLYGVSSSADLNAGPQIAPFRSLAYGPLPDPFGAISGYTTNSVPRVAVRAV